MVSVGVLGSKVWRKLIPLSRAAFRGRESAYSRDEGGRRARDRCGVRSAESGAVLLTGTIVVPVHSVNLLCASASRLSASADDPIGCHMIEIQVNSRSGVWGRLDESEDELPQKSRLRKA